MDNNYEIIEIIVIYPALVRNNEPFIGKSRSLI